MGGRLPSLTLRLRHNRKSNPQSSRRLRAAPKGITVTPLWTASQPHFGSSTSVISSIFPSGKLSLRLAVLNPSASALTLNSRSGWSWLVR